MTRIFVPPLWPSVKDAIKHMKVGLTYADIVKISGEELELLTGMSDLAKAADELYTAGCKVVLVTLGAEGCYYRYTGGAGQCAAYPVQVVDTTGSGDAFLGSFLYQMGNRSLAEICAFVPEEI